MSDLETVRAWFAEELRYVAAVKSPAVVRAFATVPRERFLGPGPWLVNTGQVIDKYWSTADADPRCVYHNVVIGLLPEKGLNNGQPSFWAFLFDRLALGAGKRVLHLGCGAGYYTAVLAELVGPTGHVMGIDVEAELVGRAQEALALWPQAEVSCADGANYQSAPVDAIVVSAGATHVLPQWLDALAPGGQLLVPLTGMRGWGQVLLVSRGATSDAFAARFAGHVGIYHFAGGRDDVAAKQLDAALFARGDVSALKSLRREPHQEDETCWLHSEGVCLSRSEPSALEP